MNYTWDDITLEHFIKAGKGNLNFVSKDGLINDETYSSWCAIQDEYIKTMDSETIEMKRYKNVCFKYVQKLQEWAKNPQLSGRVYMEVNKLYIEKTKISDGLFAEESVNWDKIIAQTTLGSKFRIDSHTMRAKEFFNIIKVL